jgi:Bardet-Biedl syndrome 9 protein
MTGGLQFFEQDSLAFETRLPGVILPGPMCFVPSNETVVTCSAACTVEAYKHMVLAAHTDPAKVRPSWALDIGEHALDVQYAPTSPSATVVVLGERTLFWLTDTGALRLSKRLESEPLCMLCYRTSGATVDTLVGTSAQQLFVLRDAQVMWSARLDFAPVALALTELSGVAGVIVALEDTGRVRSPHFAYEE